MENESFFIENTGLVITWPFLTRYFDELGMVSGGYFINESTAQRAVHLIQYLVTGRSETPEHFLVLNKIFCGLPLDTVVPESINLTEEEASLSEQLLNSILMNWPPLQNTSMEGLRESFLCRAGRLDWHEDGYWSLDVEKKPFDMLLDQLPWSISVIKLPWMENSIRVLWR